MQTLTINDTGVTREAGSILEHVHWEDVDAILIMTNDEGPLLEDFYWVLMSRKGHGCCIGGELAQEQKLLEELQARFADFDNDMVIAASCCVEEASFLCWQRDRAGLTSHAESAW